MTTAPATSPRPPAPWAHREGEMVNPLQQTTGVDVDALPETTVQDSQAPAGSAAGSALPMVGTNKVSQWATWDPNLWWTDWTLPPDPRPSWERWFDWVNQLKA